MHVTRFDRRPPTRRPTTSTCAACACRARRPGRSTQMWMGMSQILPGGHTGLDGSPIEKLYLVLEGQLTVVAELDGERDEQVLGPYDSCRFAPGEKRQLANRSNRPVLVALVMANAPPAA